MADCTDVKTKREIN